MRVWNGANTDMVTGGDQDFGLIESFNKRPVMINGENPVLNMGIAMRIYG